MKLLFIIAALLPLFAFAQKIDENNYDRFDSSLTIGTAKEILQAKTFGGPQLQASAFWLKLLHASYKNVEGKYHVLFYFKAGYVTSLNKECETKVEFSDSSISTYRFEGSYDILGSDDIGLFSTQISNNDPLFTKSIKTIRIGTTNSQFEYAVDKKATEKLSRQLSMIAVEVQKWKQKNIQ